MSNSANTHILRDQLSGIAVDQLNTLREDSRLAAHAINDELLEKAFRQIDTVRAFLQDPSTILGSEGSKHGEVAEQVEVALRNARAIIDGQDAPATFGDLGRTHAADYFINGQAIQSKFYNSIPEGLRAFIAHMEKYPDMAATGGYIMPSDRYDEVMRVISGDADGSVSETRRKAILALVEKIEAATGRSFEEVVKPSVSTYPEVQLGVIDDTLDGHDADLEDRNAEHAERIDTEHQPSLAGMAQAAAISGAISGTIATGMAMYSKAKDGKNPFRGEFTAEDWKDVGIAGGKGTAGGVLTGAAIYGMTNYAGMAAPFAGAVVSAAKGLTTLTNEYAAGNIDAEEFLDLGMFLCAESAVVGLATAAGQTFIPIPILGGIIGSISGKMMVQLAQGLSAKQAQQLQEEIDKFIATLDDTYRQVIDEINAEFEKLGPLTTAAFDFDRNYELVLVSSVNLAIAHGVADAKILRSVGDIDAFMMS